MADAIVSGVAEQLISVMKYQIQNDIQLVRGVDKELFDISDILRTIRSVLGDSDRRQFKEKRVRDWLWRLEQTSYEIDDVLDEWNYALLKHKTESESTAATNQQVCSFNLSSCLCFKKIVVRRDLAMKIRDLKSRLHEICNDKDLFNFVLSQPKDDRRAPWRVQSTSLMDLEEVRGRNDDRYILTSKLTASHEGLSHQILSIVGVGGLGKTTLAQLVYNDIRVRKCFDVSIWVCVSDPFDTFAIAKSIIDNIEHRSYESIQSLEEAFQILKHSISGKKFLLVLDDVWNEDYEKWASLVNVLKYGGTGSKILVTTRKVNVARMMGTSDYDIHYLEFLSDEDCWLLMKRLAHPQWSGMEFEYFEEIGKEIARKCRGVPFAAKALGSLLRFKNTIQEWENVLKSDIWALREMEEHLFHPLLLSYNELSPTLKLCFSYCAIFPIDQEIQVDQLIRIWMALGYLGSNIGSAGDNMELKGRECYEALAERSLFQDSKKHLLTEQLISCKMHDIVHDFAQYLRMRDRVETAGRRKRICQVCNPLIVSRAQEYRTLFWGEESPPNLCCDCLKSLRVLGFKRNLYGSLQGMENLIHLRWLDISGTKLSKEDLKTICKLYFLQTLLLALCSLKEIPEEIGNLVHLRHLHLNWNEELRELPNSTCSLHELQTLDIEGCSNLRELPEGLARLTGLRTLIEFQGGSGCNKLGLLKNLNCLTGSLDLKIKFSSTRDLEGLVDDAREAELRNKDIQRLNIEFSDERDAEEQSSSLWMDLIRALEPNHNLKFLRIWGYNGSGLPDWISSPLNCVRYISLYSFSHLSSMPAMGKLPLLEGLHMEGLEELKLVGREFLGITREGEVKDIESSSTSNALVAFPKLKELTFYGCPKWEVWEDITEEEEESAFMPCLTHLSIVSCEGLEMLPQRLLRNASFLEMLDIRSSAKLEKLYGDKDGFPLSSISQFNPQLRLQM